MMRADAISLIGDISLNGSLTFDSGNNKKRFENVSEYLNEFHIVIGNLETPVVSQKTVNVKKKNQGGVIHGTTEEIIADILPLLKIKYLTLANNHIGDFGFEGLGKTINLLNELCIGFTGAGIKDEHINPLSFNTCGKKIALISYLHNSTNPLFTDERIFVNIYEKGKIIRDIKNCKIKNDICILSLHWGKDWSYFPQKYQVSDARDFIDAGADLIVGHHTHTFQVFEEFKGKPIFYNLGDFCHGDYYNFSGELISMPLKSKKSLILKYNLNELSYNFIPIETDKNGNICIKRKISLFKNRFRTLIMRLMHRNNFIKWLINIKESVIDRIYDFLFGYRRVFRKQILKLLNIRKIRIIIRESRNNI